MVVWKNRRSPLIIAIGYKKGSGKNTLAKFLTTHLKTTTKYSVKQVSFAEKVKDISYQLFSWAGLQRAIYYETHYKDKEVILPLINKSPRDIWIAVGNHMRDIYPNVWIDYALKSNKADIIIITDLGFINEAKSILQHEGVLVKIHRDGIERGTDAREIELDMWEIWHKEISNNSSKENLYQEALNIWSYVMENKYVSE